MAREVFDIESGLAISDINGVRRVYIITGTGAPDGTSGEQQNAPIGSLYLRSGTGELYQKIANAGAPADYQLNGVSSAVVGKWRGETVSVVTAAVQGAGTRDMVASPFSDDDGTALSIGTYVVGEYVITGSAGTPVLLEITAVSGDDVTFALAGDPLVAEDTFIVKHYLPDPAVGENRAIVNYNGSVIVKLSDIDWALATGINLSSGYAAAAGTVAASDTIEAAIAKLDGNQQDIDGNVNDLITLTGVAENSTVLGAFSAPGSFLLGASLTIKAALQALADYLFGVKVTQTVGITTATAVDSVAYATYRRVQWIVEVFVTATPANREGFVIDAATDGTNVDDTKYAKLKLGANIAGLTSNVVINGANLELQIAATPSCTVNVRRITVV